MEEGILIRRGREGEGATSNGTEGRKGRREDTERGDKGIPPRSAR